MNRSIVFRIILSFVLVAIVAGLGYFAYNAGLAQGLAQNAPAAGDAAKGPYAYGYGMPFMNPYGFHAFGFLGCLAPLLLFFLFFAAMRALIWHGPHHGWRHHAF